MKPGSRNAPASSLPTRREVLRGAVAATVTVAAGGCVMSSKDALFDAAPPTVATTEDVFAFITKTAGKFDTGIYRGLIGAANPFKEGDGIVGVAAPDEATRQLA